MFIGKAGNFSVLIIGIILTSLLLAPLSYASSTSITNGINLLSANQNPEGNWGNNIDLTILDTSTVLDTFKFLNITNSSYSHGVTWLTSQYPLSTDFLSRKIISLYMAGINISTDLSALVNSRNLDGGWGGETDSTGMVIDTALALQALKAVNYSDQTIINNAISYILSTQNPDGGFGFYQGDASNVYMTAVVSSTLQQFSRTTLIATCHKQSHIVSHI